MNLFFLSTVDCHLTLFHVWKATSWHISWIVILFLFILWFFSSIPLKLISLSSVKPSSFSKILYRVFCLFLGWMGSCVGIILRLILPAFLGWNCIFLDFLFLYISSFFLDISLSNFLEKEHMRQRKFLNAYTLRSVFILLSNLIIAYLSYRI